MIPLLPAASDVTAVVRGNFVVIFREEAQYLYMWDDGREQLQSVTVIEEEGVVVHFVAEIMFGESATLVTLEEYTSSDVESSSGIFQLCIRVLQRDKQ